MPRPERKAQDSSDESEYEDNESNESEGDEKDEEPQSRQEESEHSEPPQQEATEVEAIGPRKKKKKKSYDLTTAEDLLPSHARKTKNGGYAHTNKAKSKISKANTGNTSWNKGKNRSSADRAKIAAGVRARNRSIFLEKLKRLGLTEEEYAAKRKEIKYYRERLRKAKLNNKKQSKQNEEEKRRQMVEAERKLQAAIDATTVKSQNQNSTATQESSEEKRTAEVVERVFSKDIVWTPFSFGEADGQETSYKDMCPEGGPGGLICCESCATLYFSYLNATVQDIEVQRIHRNGEEVKEILKFTKNGREALQSAFDVAKDKVPPRNPLGTTNTGTSRHGDSASRKKVELAEWNMTSALDLANTDIAASV